MTCNNSSCLNKLGRSKSLPDAFTSTPSFDLVDLLAQYSTQPELLTLILHSKLQEDKRKTEETKLRSRQIDLMRCDQNHQPLCIYPETGMKRTRSGQSPDCFSETSTCDRMEANPFVSIKLVEYVYLSLVDLYSKHESNFPMSHVDTNSLSVAGFSSSLTSSPITINALPPNPTSDSTKSQSEVVIETPVTANPQMNHSRSNTKKRIRRAMLPISSMIETREFPYNDSHHWLNNGTTIPKKSGLRSTYYKCTNWYKGCTVNKTVCNQGNGLYTIKYRGEHLSGCGRR
ncbi:hypothetical protein K493DRAFT_220696 [Basidiobolus meristosporus CBS 931.73]|uniref:WRKY domain-containing protein n=1 Tax=Basidiobolus meristosporus CBS 931.73 TaxID=1314790 RepID=A0A1Y1YAX2_9FUNG|nr:hypothetical protein K493DRAFT_220696 [Basidiobolus meristosporus CBS 931.73]|eukprot:ORX94764.1 hypothetical protein K493DRAFT_220696 [Basidiobolus meristosporus CBS 931.73]